MNIIETTGPVGTTPRGINNLIFVGGYVYIMITVTLSPFHDIYCCISSIYIVSLL